jgi:hypothetical protein
MMTFTPRTNKGAFDVKRYPCQLDWELVSVIVLLHSPSSLEAVTCGSSQGSLTTRSVLLALAPHCTRLPRSIPKRKKNLFHSQLPPPSTPQPRHILSRVAPRSDGASSTQQRRNLPHPALHPGGDPTSTPDSEQPPPTTGNRDSFVDQNRRT